MVKDAKPAKPVIRQIKIMLIIITITTSIQKKALDQLHVNHMGMEKMRLLALSPFTGAT